MRVGETNDETRSKWRVKRRRNRSNRRERKKRRGVAFDRRDEAR
jgi:hypothetical protein